MDLNNYQTDKWFPWKRNLIISFMGFHLLAMILGALEVNLFSVAPLEFVERVYGDFTGSYGGFKFFSPDIATNLRAIFEIVDQEGKTSKIFLDNKGNTESHLRVKSIINHFESDSEAIDKKLHRSLAASWASKLFSRFPKSQSITVTVQSYNLPTMNQWRNGQRPFWENYYEAKFDRNK